MLKYDQGDRPFWAIDLLIVKSVCLKMLYNFADMLDKASVPSDSPINSIKETQPYRKQQ